MTDTYNEAPASADFERVPPQDIHAEQCTLGGMLLSADAITDVVDTLQPADYYRPAHELIHNAAVALYHRGEPADPITVGAELTRRGDLVRAGGPGYLHALASTVPTAANAGYYAAIVRERAVLRRLVEAGTRIAGMGYAAEGDPEELLDAAAAELQRLTDGMRRTRDDREKPLDQMLDEYLAAYDAGEIAALPLPYLDLEAMVQAEPGDLVIVAARPAMGKSVVLMDIARSVAIRHRMGAWVSSMEMSHPQLTERIIAAEARVHLHGLRNRDLSDGDRRRVDRAVARIAGSPLLVDDSPAVPLSQLRAKLRRAAARGETPRLLVADYLQIMRAETKAGTNRTGEVDSLARGLKELAQEFRMVVVAAAQLNRQVEMRQDKTPTLADLRESGSIEAEANSVVLLHRPDYYERESPRAGELDLIVAKNRQGRTGTVTVAFQGHFSRAKDMASGD
ncbi:replicative DNA helicase [Streptomyces sp. NPDC092296]|uniref:replicative DNA helicase n=1 Tax=Streptomyces sp. NPDC092296 TaxID=3366012 RepID=UPI0037F9A209